MATPRLTVTGLPSGIENADIGSSSEAYAHRFSGAVGKWFIQTQARITLDLLGSVSTIASVLDVGGGHAQVAPALIEAGYQVTVAGSDPACATRLQPWIERARCQFQTADLLHLPFQDQSFDAVVCLRMLPHSVSWTTLLAELCRVTRKSLIIDYPSLRSVNLISSYLFPLKQRIEHDTRPFRTFSPWEIRSELASHGFMERVATAQFLLPMVLHRLAGRAGLSQTAEEIARRMGLTRWFGSPVILRADRAQSLAQG